MAEDVKYFLERWNKSTISTESSAMERNHEIHLRSSVNSRLEKRSKQEPHWDWSIAAIFELALLNPHYEKTLVGAKETILVCPHLRRDGKGQNQSG